MIKTYNRSFIFHSTPHPNSASLTHLLYFADRSLQCNGEFFRLAIFVYLLTLSRAPLNHLRRQRFSHFHSRFPFPSQFCRLIIRNELLSMNERNISQKYRVESLEPGSTIWPSNNAQATKKCTLIVCCMYLFNTSMPILQKIVLNTLSCMKFVLDEHCDWE